MQFKSLYQNGAHAMHGARFPSNPLPPYSQGISTNDIEVPCLPEAACVLCWWSTWLSPRVPLWSNSFVNEPKQRRVPVWDTPILERHRSVTWRSVAAAAADAAFESLTAVDCYRLACTIRSSPDPCPYELQQWMVSRTML